MSCNLFSLIFFVFGMKISSDSKISQFSSVQLLSCVWLFAIPWIEAHQASMSITNSQSSLRLTSIESLQSCPILRRLHGLYSLPGSSVHGILQARLLEWVAISFSRGSSQPRDPALQDSLHHLKPTIKRHC